MLQHRFFFTLLIAASVAFIILLLPFFQPILWAAALAVLFFPFHTRLFSSQPRRANLAALGTLGIILVTVIVPSFFLSAAVVDEGLNLYEAISEEQIDYQRPIRWAEENTPSLINLGEKFGVRIENVKEKLSEFTVQASRWLATHVFTIGQNTLRFTAQFFLMLYLLFFFLRDGRKLIDLMIRVLPIGDKQERFLFSKFAEVSRATIKGSVIVGLVQGALGALIFWLLGIDSALFWGVVMAILSLLPAIGAALVWIPAAILLFVDGNTTSSIILVVYGVAVIGMADNVLRPILVGKETKMPDYLILLSTLGGIALFGLSGLILGPLIASFFLATWTLFEQQYNPANYA